MCVNDPSPLPPVSSVDNFLPAKSQAPKTFCYVGLFFTRFSLQQLYCNHVPGHLCSGIRMIDVSTTHGSSPSLCCPAIIALRTGTGHEGMLRGGHPKQSSTVSYALLCVSTTKEDDVYLQKQCSSPAKADASNDRRMI